MIDPKIKTLLTLTEVGNYTQTAKRLALTQPAVSYQIKSLEEQYGIEIFYRGNRQLKPTPEGEILISYARRLANLEKNARGAIEDLQKNVQRFRVGITTTLGEYLVPEIFVNYCKRNPHVQISIITEAIKEIYNMLSNYELDWAIVEGHITEMGYVSLLLDTDYLCLVVSPQSHLARRSSVSVQELRQEKFVLRTPEAGTRSLFEQFLTSMSETIENFNVVIETNNIKTIKELVAANLGVTIISHSAVEQDLARGKLISVPVDGLNIVREINLVYLREFRHAHILDDIRKAYTDQQEWILDG